MILQNDKNTFFVPQLSGLSDYFMSKPNKTHHQSTQRNSCASYQDNKLDGPQILLPPKFMGGFRNRDTVKRHRSGSSFVGYNSSGNPVSAKSRLDVMVHLLFSEPTPGRWGATPTTPAPARRRVAGLVERPAAECLAVMIAVGGFCFVSVGQNGQNSNPWYWPDFMVIIKLILIIGPMSEICLYFGDGCVLM